MCTLRQAGLSILHYYDEDEKKLTRLTNKAHMTYEKRLEKGMCENFWGDALGVFISGLKCSLTEVLFSTQPSDLATALALAQEVEANHESYVFAASFARVQEEKGRTEQHMQGRQQQQQQDRKHVPQGVQGKSPHSAPEPMDVDP